MPERIANPAQIEAAGNVPKQIQEYVGRVRTQTESVSVARTVSPAGWAEPAQCPEFDEVTLVLRGTLEVESAGGRIAIGAGEAVLARAGETVRYATASETEYIAVCAPAWLRRPRCRSSATCARR